MNKIVCDILNILFVFLKFLIVIFFEINFVIVVGNLVVVNVKNRVYIG